MQIDKSEDIEGRSYKIIYRNNQKFFLKEYKDKNIELNNLINDEFEKGKKLSNLINYPTPLKINKNKILYEYLNINYSLYESLNNGTINLNYITKVAKFLRIIHDNGIIHGDLNTANVIITKDNKLYFIDASFSKYTNDYTVNFNDKNIYQDISNFLIFLKWIRELQFIFWVFIQRKKINQSVDMLLKIYFKGNQQNFDPQKNIKMENQFLTCYLKYIRENKKIYLQLIWIILIKIIISFNKLKYGI